MKFAVKLAVLLLLAFPYILHGSTRECSAQDAAVPTLHRFELALGYSPSELVVGDFNGDRIADLALIEPLLHRLVILYGSGSLEEFTPKFFALAHAAQDLQVADVNHDGISDLMVLTKAPARLICYYGHSAEQLLPKAELDVDTGAEKLVLFAMLHRTAIFFYGQMRGIGYAEYSPLSGFVRKSTLASESIFSKVELLAPSSKDALPSLMAYSPTEHAAKLIRTGPDSLLGSVSIRLERPLSSLAVADFNQNGLADAVLGLGSSRYAPNELRVIYDIGISTGYPPAQLSLDAPPTRLHTHDLNGDGYTDILALNSDAKQLSLFFGKADGEFLDRYTLGIDEALQFRVADLNNDKLPEIVFVQPTEKRLVIFSTTAMREHKKSSLLYERLVICPNPTSIVALPSKSQMQIVALGQTQSSLFPMTAGKTWQAHPLLSLGYKAKFIFQPNDSPDIVAVSETSDRLSIFALKSVSALEKIADLPILALNITGLAHWRLNSNSSLFFLIDRSNHEMLPQLISYRLLRSGRPQLSEVTFAPFVPIERLLFLHSARWNRQPLVSAIEQDPTHGIRARLYAFGKQTNNHVHLIEKTQIRLFSSDTPLHTCLCEDFDGDEKPDWLLASATQTWLFLSRNRYKEESLNKLLTLSASDFVKVIDLNGDGHLDILIGKSNKQQLCVAFGSKHGKFHSMQVIASNVLARDAKLLKLDSDTLLLVANAKLHTLDVLKLDHLNTLATVRK
jgi:hypothetical protein